MSVCLMELCAGLFASLCTIDHLSEGGDTGHAYGESHNDQHEDGEPELTEDIEDIALFTEVLCQRTTTERKERKNGKQSPFSSHS